ncbi:MAG: GDP-mannose 4,6-dehydratase [Candidatus Jettenia caeni]|nr:GDP-mannose 4,6-dehydratase [Candidatus Jettenia caeni]
MKTAIITGITGQDGAYLSGFLLNKNYKVIGIVRNASVVNAKNLKYLGVYDKIVLIEANLLDLSNIIRILDKNKPDEFYNLAAQSSVSLSFEQPIGTLEFNIVSVANILEAVKIVNPEIKFYQASSSEMFGNVRKENLPVNESFVFHPVSPYGISKAAAHWITVNYREAYGMFSACGILFNHESILRGKNFVTKKILNTAVKIRMGEAEKLHLGNLKIYRDWGYAPKYVEAMWLMLQQESPKDYIICSGEAHSLEEFVQKVFEKLDLELEKFVTIDKNLYRPVDLEIIYGDNSEARGKLGWNYDMSFDQLMNRLIEDEIQYNVPQKLDSMLR